MMSALTPQQTRAMRAAINRPGAPDERRAAENPAEQVNPAGAPLPQPIGDASPDGSLAEIWAGLHRQAARLAQLAQLAPEPYTGALAAFPAQIGAASEWQRDLAWQGIDDIDAMLQPGLAALATLERRGMSTAAPALALWREFHEARGAIMALAHTEATAA